MSKKIHSHFKKNDPTLHLVMEKIGYIEIEPPRKPEQYFVSLCSEIISQQLAGKAAEAIYKRFEKLFPKGKITPEKVLAVPDEKLRGTGVSWAKVSYLKDLAKKVKDKEVRFDHLHTLLNEEVIAELTKVKGIGPWTAEMFLMFTIGREDIFSHGDLGLKNAMKKIYKFKKEPTRKQIEKIISKWSPYRTYACRILWKSLEL